nr:phage head closure protein [Luteimonas saliphila]
MRHRIELQAPVTTQDPITGEMETTWQTYARVWAEIVPLSAREFIAASAEQSEVRGRITIRRRADVNASHRAVHRGMAYDILGVLADPVSGLEYQTLPVSEGVKVA